MDSNHPTLPLGRRSGVHRSKPGFGFGSGVQGDKMLMVACGWRHTICVGASGALYTYGWSKYGQLGHGDFADHLVPATVEALKGHKIKQVGHQGRGDGDGRGVGQG